MKRVADDGAAGGSSAPGGPAPPSRQRRSAFDRMLDAADARIASLGPDGLGALAARAFADVADFQREAALMRGSSASAQPFATDAEFEARLWLGRTDWHHKSLGLAPAPCTLLPAHAPTGGAGGVQPLRGDQHRRDGDQGA
jgi:hypothetical protein